MMPRESQVFVQSGESLYFWLLFFILPKKSKVKMLLNESTRIWKGGRRPRKTYICNGNRNVMRLNFWQTEKIHSWQLNFQLCYLKNDGHSLSPVHINYVRLEEKSTWIWVRKAPLHSINLKKTCSVFHFLHQLYFEPLRALWSYINVEKEFSFTSF